MEEEEEVYVGTYRDDTLVSISVKCKVVFALAIFGFRNTVRARRKQRAEGSTRNRFLEDCASCISRCHVKDEQKFGNSEFFWVAGRCCDRRITE